MATEDKRERLIKLENTVLKAVYGIDNDEIFRGDCGTPYFRDGRDEASRRQLEKYPQFKLPKKTQRLSVKKTSDPQRAS